MRESTVKRVYEHVFENKYSLEEGYKRFNPDYYMAVSWQRLREGRDIKEMDRVLLKHEALEHYLMNKYNLRYYDAHNLTRGKYNYNNYVWEVQKDAENKIKGIK